MSSRGWSSQDVVEVERNCTHMGEVDPIIVLRSNLSYWSQRV